MPSNEVFGGKGLRPQMQGFDVVLRLQTFWCGSVISSCTPCSPFVSDVENDCCRDSLRQQQGLLLVSTNEAACVRLYSYNQCSLDSRQRLVFGHHRGGTGCRIFTDYRWFLYWRGRLLFCTCDPGFSDQHCHCRMDGRGCLCRCRSDTYFQFRMMVLEWNRHCD